MNFALDWDGTAGADPETFAEVVKLLRKKGHSVFICTMRYEDEERIPDLFLDMFRDENNESITVHYTGRRAKAAFCELAGIKVDVWIDDKPYFLYSDG